MKMLLYPVSGWRLAALLLLISAGAPRVASAALAVCVKNGTSTWTITAQVQWKNRWGAWKNSFAFRLRPGQRREIRYVTNKHFRLVWSSRGRKLSRALDLYRIGAKTDICKTKTYYYEFRASKSGHIMLNKRMTITPPKPKPLPQKQHTFVGCVANHTGATFVYGLRVCYGTRCGPFKRATLAPRKRMRHTIVNPTVPRYEIQYYTAPSGKKGGLWKKRTLIPSLNSCRGTSVTTARLNRKGYFRLQ